MLDFLIEYRSSVQITLSWLVCLSALRWGGGPERMIALVWLAVLELFHRAYHVFWNPVFQIDQFDTFHASVDLIAAVGFMFIALNANRLYILWIASFQLIALSAHLARGVADDISPIAYAFLVIAPSWFQLAIFAGGLIAHIRRKRKWGEYRDWRWSEPGLGAHLAKSSA